MSNPEEEQEVDQAIDRLARECAEEEAQRLGSLAVNTNQLVLFEESPND